MLGDQPEGVQPSALSDEEVEEIRELYPELSDVELRRFISALDCTIDKLLDAYFGLGGSN